MIDSLFIHSEKTPEPNVRYFSATEVISLAILIKKKESILFVPHLEYEKAKKESKVKVELLKMPIDKLIKKHFGKKIGVNYQSFPIGISKKIKADFIDVGKECYDLRAIKSDEEIENIRKACEITDMAFASAIKNWNFKTETDVAIYLENRIKEQGAELAFSTIVGSGKNSSQPHYSTSNSKLNNGFCVIDFGAKYNGYCADMTRTVFIGSPSNEEIQFYGLVKKSQQNAVDSVKLGIKTKKIDDVARKILGKYSKNFIHGLGHGVGLEIHESPNLSSKSKDSIKKGHAFTIEPGIYFEGKFGIRIEDTLAFTDKLEILTKSSKELIIIKPSE